jgi:hypothetical protein
MQTRSRGTSRRCGGGFAKQVAGNVEKREAPTFFRHRIQIRLDENLDGLFAGINLYANGRVTEIDLVSSSVRSSNDGVGHMISLERGQRRSQATFRPVPPQADVLVIKAWNGAGDWIKLATAIRRRAHERTTLFPYCATVILVGVADSILQLVHDHGSISRNIAQVPMERMSPSEIRDIIVTRVRRLRMRITEDTVWRISYFSAGLPFYAHSLGKYTALQAVAKQRISITEGDLMNSLDDCIADVDYIVTEGYTRATGKIYRKPNIFTKVLAACALCETNDLGQFTAADVEGPLSAIMGEPYRVPSFAFHLNEMSGPGRGNVLRKRGARRTYQYNFAEPAMQPFVIMKNLKDGIISRTLFEQFYVKRQGSLSI